MATAITKKRNEILEVFIKMLVDKFYVLSQDIKLESSFTNDLFMDSLDKVEFIMELEKHFSISIPDEKVESLTTVLELLNYLDDKIKEL